MTHSFPTRRDSDLLFGRRQVDGKVRIFVPEPPFTFMFHDCCPGFSYWPAGWFAASRYQKSVLAVLNYFLGVTFTDQSPAWHSISEKQNNMVPVFMVIGQGHAYFSRLIFLRKIEFYVLDFPVNEIHRVGDDRSGGRR